MTSTAFKFTPEQMLAQMNKNQAKSSGPRTEFHKLEQGDNVLRFVSDGSVVPFVSYWQQWGVGPDGKRMAAVDLDWLFSEEGANVLEASDLTSEDADFVGRYGDPVKQLRDAILPPWGDSDEEKSARQEANQHIRNNDGPSSARGVVAVAVMEGVIGLVRIPGGVFQTVLDAWNDDPSIILPDAGMDFKVTKTGQGKTGTRYTTTALARTLGTPVELHSDEVIYPNPAEAVAQRVLSYEDKVKFVRRSYGQFVPEGFRFGGEEG